MSIANLVGGEATTKKGASAVPVRSAKQQWLFAVWPYRVRPGEVKQVAQKLLDFATKKEIKPKGGYTFANGVVVLHFTARRVRRGVELKRYQFKGREVVVGYKRIVPKTPSRSNTIRKK